MIVKDMEHLHLLQNLKVVNKECRVDKIQVLLKLQAKENIMKHHYHYYWPKIVVDIEKNQSINYVLLDITH